jgi:hypothetical protein
MSDALDKDDTYLKRVSLAVAAGVSTAIGHSLMLTTETTRHVNEDEDELDIYGPGAQIESVKYQGIAYDLLATKEKGPSRTIRFELRLR